MPYGKRNVRPWWRRAWRGPRICQRSSVCCVLARQLAARGRGPSGLARACFRRWRLALERFSFRAGAGGASSRARRRTDAPRWSAKYCGKVTPLTQRICNLRDRPRRGAAGLGRNAWAHVAGTLISRTRFQRARRNGRTLRAFSRRARGSRAGSHGLAGRTRSCSTRPGR